MYFVVHPYVRNIRMSQLTTRQVALINCRLKDISDTWADLWIFLHLVPIGVSRAIDLRYCCFDGKSLTCEERGRFKEKQFAASQAVLICDMKAQLQEARFALSQEKQTSELNCKINQVSQLVNFKLPTPPTPPTGCCGC